MIIKGANNTQLHIMESNRPGKVMVVVTKDLADGVHKSTKLTVDSFKSYGEESHSLEFGGVHYALIPGMDFVPVSKRIYYSKAYRRYRRQFAA